jgi:16S rRNA (uracil1498-N3)-methyltransferase
VSPRHLFLAAPPGPDPTFELAPGEAHHGLHVLRLTRGDEIIGLDGQGGAWPLRVTAAGRRELVLEPAGEAHRYLPPRPALEIALSLPRGGRAEDNLDRLTQLGVAAVRPTLFERTQGPDRELSERRRERLERVAREACKQSGRPWLPRIHGPEAFGEVLALEGPAALLDPTGEVRLLDWLSGQRGASELRLLVGPEGGATEGELAAARKAGAALVSLAGPVLRIETAAELACGLALQVLSGT